MPTLLQRLARLTPYLRPGRRGLIGAGLGTVMGNLQVLIVGLAAWALFGERLRRQEDGSLTLSIVPQGV